MVIDHTRKALIGRAAWRSALNISIILVERRELSGCDLYLTSGMACTAIRGRRYNIRSPASVLFSRSSGALLILYPPLRLRVLSLSHLPWGSVLSTAWQRFGSLRGLRYPLRTATLSSRSSLG